MLDESWFVNLFELIGDIEMERFCYFFIFFFRVSEDEMRDSEHGSNV